MLHRSNACRCARKTSGFIEKGWVNPDRPQFVDGRLAQVKQGAAESLPFEGASFDLVTGLDVVEHLDDDIAGLSEMRRVLRPDGRAVLFVPAFMFLWGVQDDISNHRRRKLA